MLIFGLKRPSNDPEDLDIFVHTRLLPPSDWLTRNYASLISIFGQSYLANIEEAAADPERSSHEGYEELSGSEGNLYDWDAEEIEEDFYDEGYYENDDPWRKDFDYYAETAWGTKEVKDSTACNEGCGYCGKCEY